MMTVVVQKAATELAIGIVSAGWCRQLGEMLVVYKGSPLCRLAAGAVTAGY
ncbi:hypothetical protein U3938_09770 [Escherichia coli]|uniref:hypothetical protein n=1 Tax=Escherichia coli TaxID=562 RepID=UPI002D7668B1|nr:hypothetical protein [Escherichia coli]WRQ37948.1 hypothetical protein U3938_09770 [Escherichia coli]